MIFQEKQIILKDGRTAILKSPEACDAQKMLDFITVACGETDFLARYPEEYERIGIDGERDWIIKGRESSNRLLITCYVDGEIVGNCDLTFYGGMKNATEQPSESQSCKNIGTSESALQCLRS